MFDHLEMNDPVRAHGYYQIAPESYFVQQHVCSHITEDGRICLADDRLIVTRNGQQKETPIEDEKAFVRALN